MPIRSKEYVKDYHKVFGASAITFLGSYLIGDYLGYPVAGYVIGSLLVPAVALIYSGEMSTRIEKMYRVRFREEMEKIVKVVPKTG